MEEFIRTESLLGKDNFSKLRNAKIIIFGIGGVGSYVCEALARAGIENFILVDNDVVATSNINRQIIALHSTIGLPKVEVMKERIIDINPNAKITTHQVTVNSANSLELIEADCSYIIDAIDSVASKVDLIEKSKLLNIPIISCMGTGNKLDPTKFKITDISKTSVCPLARAVRKELKDKNIEDIKVLYSTEEPINKKEPDTNTKYQVPASISFVPATAGLIIASEVIKDIS